jgi:acetate kinase
MTEAIAVLNAGSSSIKFSLFAAASEVLALEVHGQVEGIYTAPHFIARDSKGATAGEKRWSEGRKLDHAGALEHLIAFMRTRLGGEELAAIGHRVVHGGMKYRQPVRLDPDVLRALAQFTPLAPLHQPHNLAPIALLFEQLPQVPQVACFDTSFHRTNAEITQMFAVPSWLHEKGVRRYGFHGLSYEYVAQRLAALDPQAASGRTVILHLGNGSSMCAIVDGRSVASTMGFTALEGLPMGTRCGAIDPGVILYLMAECGMDAQSIERLLYTECGLLGVSGVSSDMRALLESAQPRAALAVDLYLYRIRRELGSLTAALQGIDALVFTAGIGENSARLRARVCQDAAWLGVKLDADANAAARGAACISKAGSRVSAWVVPTDEELMIARHTRSVLREQTAPAA